MNILLLLTSSFLFPINIQYNIPSDSLFVGSIVSFEVHLENLNDDEFPTFNTFANDSSYSLQEYKHYKNHADFKIQFWEKGLVTIPPIAIDIINSKKVQYSVHTKPIDFFIFSHLNDSNLTLKKNKGMLFINLINKNKLVLILIIIIALLFLSAYFYKKINRNKEEQKVIEKNDINIYSSIVDKINNLKLPINGNANEVQEFYAKLSYILRDFMKKKFYIRSTEMTTHEIFQYLRNKGFKSEIYNMWNRINEKSDMAKYALSNFKANDFNDDKEAFILFIEKLNKL